MTESISKISNQANWDLKWRPGYKIVCIVHDGHLLHIKNQATGKTRSCNIKDVVLKLPVKLWNFDTQLEDPSTIMQICQLPHLPIEDEKTLLMYIVTCK